MSGAAIPEGPDPPFGPPPRRERPGLLCERAAPRHAERARRIALEAALEAAGVLSVGACETAADSPPVRTRTMAALDHAMAGLIRVMTEDVDPRTPLRKSSRATTS